MKRGNNDASKLETSRGSHYSVAVLTALPFINLIRSPQNKITITRLILMCAFIVPYGSKQMPCIKGSGEFYLFVLR